MQCRTSHSGPLQIRDRIPKRYGSSPRRWKLGSRVTHLVQRRPGRRLLSPSAARRQRDHVAPNIRVQGLLRQRTPVHHRIGHLVPPLGFKLRNPNLAEDHGRPPQLPATPAPGTRAKSPKRRDCATYPSSLARICGTPAFHRRRQKKAFSASGPMGTPVTRARCRAAQK